MYPIHADQIKAARAMLDWSQEDLAQATGLSTTTIRNLETGTISPRNATNSIIRQVIESAGLELLDSEGVRRRREEVTIYQGVDSCETFFDDMLQTVKKKGGDILCSVRSQELLLRSCGVSLQGKSRMLEKLTALASFKCLVAESATTPILKPALQFRMISKTHVGPMPYYIYGDKQALVLMESDVAFRFVVFQSASWVRLYREHFCLLWDHAAPVSNQNI